MWSDGGERKRRGELAHGTQRDSIVLLALTSTSIRCHCHETHTYTNGKRDIAPVEIGGV